MTIERLDDGSTERAAVAPVVPRSGRSAEARARTGIGLSGGLAAVGVIGFQLLKRAKAAKVLLFGAAL